VNCELALLQGMCNTDSWILWVGKCAMPVSKKHSCERGVMKWNEECMNEVGFRTQVAARTQAVGECR
jgi:hypothetical protein